MAPASAALRAGGKVRKRKNQVDLFFVVDVCCRLQQDPSLLLPSPTHAAHLIISFYHRPLPSAHLELLESPKRPGAASSKRKSTFSEGRLL